MMKPASVVSESGVGGDIWAVENKRDDMKYTIARVNDPTEMNALRQKGYVPATGEEQFLVRSFDGSEDTKVGDKKIRGNRIIMCCPQKLVAARQQGMDAKYADPRKASEDDARAMRRANRDVPVTARGEKENGINI